MSNESNTRFTCKEYRSLATSYSNGSLDQHSYLVIACQSLRRNANNSADGWQVGRLCTSSIVVWCIIERPEQTLAELGRLDGVAGVARCITSVDVATRESAAIWLTDSNQRRNTNQKMKTQP